LCTGQKLYDLTQKLQTIKLKPCTITNTTDCYSKQVIPQPALRAGAKKNVVVLPGKSAYQIKSDGVTTVVVDLVVQRIENIHPELNKITIMGFPRMWWVDERLAWNPAD
jgi:hypothetical protein